jgi:capsular exopolysaccharide synthesis family protein
VLASERDPEEAAQVVEAFRTIRMNLAHSYGAAGPVLLTVSSPGAGDGKSLVSSNLALSFAEAGYRTLLIDGDIRRGELHRMFSTDRRPGLLDYLVGETHLESVVRSTTHRNLSLIPCGTRHHHGPELLGSNAMRELMAQVKSRYNVVIIDSPPLGAGIDPFVLGTATANLLLVLRSGETDRQMAEEKLKLLDRLPIRILGAVLNDIRTDGVYKYYSYIYGYTADEETIPQLAAPAGDAGAS